MSEIEREVEGLHPKPMEADSVCGPEKAQETRDVRRKASQLPSPSCRGVNSSKEIQGPAQSHCSNALSWGLLQLLISIPSLNKLEL